MTLQVLPGHFYGGKNFKQAQQFALTPVQLRMREYAESLEDMSGSTYMADRYGGHLKDDDYSSPLSNRSSLEHLMTQENLFRISV